MNQLRDWRRTTLEGLPRLFEGRDATATLKVTQVQQVTDLDAEIGRLTTELSWLKKSCHEPDPCRAPGPGGASEP